MSLTLNSPPLPGAPPALGLRLFVAGALLAGGVAGLVVNHGAAFGGASAARQAVPVPVEGSPLREVALLPVADVAAGSGARDAGFRVVAVNVVPPDDPFRPTKADALAPVLPVKPAAKPAGEDVRFAPRAGAVSKSAGAEPPPPAPRLEGVTVAGIIQGEPPVALVRHSGQSLFLKVGDQVAGSWRLAEINERSAVFQLGEQRVEVPIQGGSSQ